MKSITFFDRLKCNSHNEFDRSEDHHTEIQEETKAESGTPDSQLIDIDLVFAN